MKTKEDLITLLEERSDRCSSPFKFNYVEDLSKYLKNMMGNELILPRVVPLNCKQITSISDIYRIGKNKWEIEFLKPCDKDSSLVVEKYFEFMNEVKNIGGNHKGEMHYYVGFPNEEDSTTLFVSVKDAVESGFGYVFLNEFNLTLKYEGKNQYRATSQIPPSEFVELAKKYERSN